MSPQEWVDLEMIITMRVLQQKVERRIRSQQLGQAWEGIERREAQQLRDAPDTPAQVASGGDADNYHPAS